MDYKFHALFDLTTERFVRFGMKTSVDDLATYWMDDISGEVFSLPELETIRHYMILREQPIASIRCFNVVKFLNEVCTIENLLCIPCEEHYFDSLDYIHSVMLLDL